MSNEEASDVEITFVDNGKRIKAENILLRLNQVKAKIEELCTL
jgi:hypothetical protein